MFNPVIRRYYEFFLYVICSFERSGKFRAATTWIPFHLEQRELSVTFLNIVNFLLCCSAPEITVDIFTRILVVFNSFTYDEILP